MLPHGICLRLYATCVEKALEKKVARLKMSHIIHLQQMLDVLYRQFQTFLCMSEIVRCYGLGESLSLVPADYGWMLTSNSEREVCCDNGQVLKIYVRQPFSLSPSYVLPVTTTTVDCFTTTQW